MTNESPEPCERIEKPAGPVQPNLVDYSAARTAFSWEAARAALEGLPGGGLNIAHEAVDHHAARTPERVALRLLRADGRVEPITYAALRAETARFARLLEALGVARGERVFTLLGRVPELYTVVLGALKRGAVLCPLFAAFGPEPIRTRLELGQARVLVTSASLYERKVAPIRAALPDLQVLLIDEPRAPLPGVELLRPLLAAQPDDYEVPATHREEPALLHFTSGTTGKPKGAVHVHEAVVWHRESARLALDLQADDVFWCTADPGWVTGMSYGVIAPLVLGAVSIVDEAEFDPERWYATLERQGVTVWYTAPTAIRRLIRAGAELAGQRDLSRLRLVCSVGEPLTPDAVRWGIEALGLPIHDNWWQTETGGIMIANFAALAIRPGSMGFPLPGVEAAIVRPGPRGLEALEAPGQEGELALRPGWPSMFRAYLNDEARYARCFADGWYLTGDLARRDDEGRYWFVGRKDDVINTAGHLVGPFEVESALSEHPEVAEAAAIGKPDPVAMEVVKAFVVLRPGAAPSERLRRELLGFARTRLGPAVAPRELELVDALPKTRSGKVLRRLLKARELGLPEGDTSTLEEG